MQQNSRVSNTLWLCWFDLVRKPFGTTAWSLCCLEQWYNTTSEEKTQQDGSTAVVNQEKQLNSLVPGTWYVHTSKSTLSLAATLHRVFIKGHHRRCARRSWQIPLALIEAKATHVLWPPSRMRSLDQDLPEIHRGVQASRT